MKKFRQAVAALVLRPSSVCSPDGCGVVYDLLLVHKPRKSDAWQLPQGGIEEGENKEQAARRELMEEAGITVGNLLTNSDISYTYEFPPSFIERHKPVNDGQTLLFLSFLADPSATVKVDQKEIDKHVWITPDRLRRYVEREEYAVMIEKVLAEATAKLSSQSHATS